jgi:hypothetical protein
VDWIGRARPRLRRSLLVAGLVLSTVPLATTLPIVPLSALHDTQITLDPTTRDSIGWPVYVREIAQVYRSLPAAQRSSAVVVTSNYGEAGAVDLFGPADGLPAAYSPQTGFWYWGPPPASKTVAIIVGADRAQVRFCGSLRLAAILDDHAGIASDEQGKSVWICTALSESWSVIWPQVRYLG